MKNKLNHEVFGEIFFKAGFVKEIELEMFGVRRKIEVVIDAEEDGEFEELQIETYKNFFRSIDQRVRDAENAILSYYNSESLQYREKLTRKDELSNLVTPRQIMFPLLFNDNKREAGFICDCSWDIEHGLGVRFVNEKVTEVGYQDTLL